MLSAEQLAMVVKTSERISELVEEYLELDLQLRNLRTLRERAVESGDLDLVYSIIDGENSLAGSMGADEQLIKLNAQLIETNLM